MENISIFDTLVVFMMSFGFPLLNLLLINSVINEIDKIQVKLGIKEKIK